MKINSLLRETFSSDERNDQMEKGAPKLSVNHNTDLNLKIGTDTWRILKSNEEFANNRNQSKWIKIHKHGESEQNHDNNKGQKQSDEKLKKKYGLNNGKQLQIRTFVFYLKNNFIHLI
ncbi:unnamed protein product [Onchocerca flexuosa]|uniref:Uncharacterized protein n=1 Tax=Onchocerca flexuosa TaxID=387005 RepID=A0A183HWC1_9BILA|nr:unnamed protein product [Onchocerca flexuosa]